MSKIYFNFLKPKTNSSTILFYRPNPPSLALYGGRVPPGMANIGRGDLDPLGQQGGGMLFPRTIAQLGGIPRFDPYGPINPNRNNQDPRRNRFGPNNDQFRPPGNGADDYYF